MNTYYKVMSLILLCSVSLTGCKQSSKPKPASKPKVVQHKGVVQITSQDQFDQLIADGNVIIDFYASWCGPCQRMAPIFDELAQEMSNIKFVKVDIEAYNDLAKKFNVKSIPTLIFMQNGIKVRQLSGARTKAGLRTELDQVFSAN